MKDKNIVNYNFTENEIKWQKNWEEREIMKFNLKDDSREKYYVLVMLPYPSGKLHVGHLRNYTIGDVMARFKKLQGFNVLHPMGWDAFGLPAENAAISNNKKPQEWTDSNIAAMRAQQKQLGLVYDWSKEISSCSPDYYKHQQYLFLKMYEKGLIYKKESFVNWDPVDQTVLANEQVIDGKGWRSGAEVEKKKIDQWFFKISDFSEDLLEGLKELDGWPEKVKKMQEKWIGKSEGGEINFPIVGDENKSVKVFTTRPETIFGSSYIAISTDHPIAKSAAETSQEVKEFILECEKAEISKSYDQELEKAGISTGLYAKNPINTDQPELPIYITNFVKSDYGTGAVFACPSSDERDFEFALKYHLPLRPVAYYSSETKSSYEEAIFNFAKQKNIKAENIEDIFIEISKLKNIDLESVKSVFLRSDASKSIIYNSDFLDNHKSADAKKLILDKISKNGFGRKKVNYRLKDWGVSRQRYWGCPIPIINCNSCGSVAEEIKNLPVKLPEIDNYEIGNILEKHPTWKKCKCPKCGNEAEREQETLDTFFDSSWYFLRYPFASLEDAAFDQTRINEILPVDEYIGGIEHAILHLLYSRFFVRALEKLNMVKFKEPFKKLITQGMVCHKAYQNTHNKWIRPENITHKDGKLYDENGILCQDKGSMKMSKSKLNVVDPEDIIKTYGADAARLFIVSDTPIEKDMDWKDQAIESSLKYINRIWKISHKIESACQNSDLNDEGKKVVSEAHICIKNITQRINSYDLNKAISFIHILTNKIEDAIKAKADRNSVKEAFTILIQLVYPFTPHISEELWQKIGNKSYVSESSYPKYNPSLVIQDEIKIPVQINGKLKSVISIDPNSSGEDQLKKALEDEKISSLTNDKEITKKIVVQGKIINLIVK